MGVLCATDHGESYAIRYNAGKAAAIDLWTQIIIGSVYVKRDVNGKIIGKIDIVAHSMGYAYAQGMIDELKTHLAPGVTFGRFYILAPENACSSTTFNKSLFDEVWQYGSHEILDPLWEQDGVAPQCAVPGLTWQIVDNSYGRIRIPTSDPNRDFLGCHYGSSYKWIFTLQRGSAGYVKAR